MLCVCVSCVCPLATMQLHPEGLSTNRRDRQDANRQADNSWSRVRRTLTLRAENVSRRHIYRIDCQEGTPGSTVDQFFDSSLSTASWMSAVDGKWEYHNSAFDHTVW